MCIRDRGLAGNLANTTYRLVHGEGDNLPGLIIDVDDHTAVMQAHSAGMHVYRMEIADALSEVMGDVVRNIYYKSETTLPFKADLGPENGFIKGGSCLLYTSRFIMNVETGFPSGINSVPANNPYTPIGRSI